MTARRVLIAGLGLIGGSIALALRGAGWHVAYLDPYVSDSGEAADECVDSFEEADLTILATPVDVAIEMVREATGLVTSVCSVMQPLRAAAGQSFIAGHPLAGSQERGLRAARRDLFHGARWFVDREDPLLDEVIGLCGAKRELVDAGEHDRAVAVTSHLPQILSTALAAHLDGVDLERFAGSGLRSFLRLAGSDSSVWQPVIEANRANVGPHAEAVARIVREILEGDATAFARAQRVWERLQR